MKPIRAFIVFAVFSGLVTSQIQAQTSRESIGRFLNPMTLPGGVKSAVDDISVMGRVEGDFFAFQRVELYKLSDSAAEPRLKKILSDIIEASRQHGPHSVAEFCMNGFDDNGRLLAFDDDHECATHLMGFNKFNRWSDVSADLRSWYREGSAEDVRMERNLNRLQKLINRLVGGENLEVISVMMSGLNVSEETVLLINKQKGHVVILKYDYGA